MSSNRPLGRSQVRADAFLAYVFTVCHRRSLFAHTNQPAPSTTLYGAAPPLGPADGDEGQPVAGIDARRDPRPRGGSLATLRTVVRTLDPLERPPSSRSLDRPRSRHAARKPRVKGAGYPRPRRLCDPVRDRAALTLRRGRAGRD